MNTFQPTLDHRQGGVAGQIDLQRGHRNKVLCNGMEVGSWAGILAGAGGADPVYGAAAWILCRNDGLRAMAVAESAGAEAAKLFKRNVGDIDVENQGAIARQGLAQQLLHQQARYGGTGLEVAAASR